MTPAYASELVLIRRRLAGSFTQIPNELIRDRAVNWKALGLLVYLLSLPRTKFHISLERLCAAKLDGEAAVRSAMKQLESLGYLKVVRERATSGRFVRTRWLVSDQPIMDWAPHLENPAVDDRAMKQPDAGDQGPTNTEFVEIQKNPITTTTPTASEAPLEIGDEDSQEIWLWLCQKLSLDSDKARRDCSGLNQSIALDVLAEVYECKRQGSIRKSVPQFLSSLLRKAREGKFHLSAGTTLRKDIPEILRRQRALQAAAAAAPGAAAKDGRIGSVPPRERIRQLREKLAHRGHAIAPAGAKNG